MASSSALSGGVTNQQSSILMPTIPIFHLQQSASETISLIAGGTQTTSVMCTGNDLVDRSAINTSSFLNIDVSSDAGCNTGAKGSFNCAGNAADLSIDWSNSLFRPASRFSISNRRECKVKSIFYSLIYLSRFYFFSKDLPQSHYYLFQKFFIW